jgi:hypothetical protein
MEAISGHMQQVIGHDIAPADLVMKHGYFRELAFLFAFFLVVLVPLFKEVHFGRFRKNDLEEGFLGNLFQVVVHVMVVLMAVANDLGSYHVGLLCISVTRNIRKRFKFKKISRPPLVSGPGFFVTTHHPRLMDFSNKFPIFTPSKL